MYYPKQIPYLLDETFKKYATYQEYHYLELQDYCMCIWRITSKSNLREPLFNTILPDGCIDLIIDLETESTLFSGFSRNTEILELNGKVNYLGVRFKPGGFYALFKTSSEQVMNHTVPFHDIEPKPELNGLFTTTQVEQQLDLLKEYLLTKIKKSAPPEYMNFVDLLYHDLRDQRVTEMARQFSYGDRQLLRIFKKYYGVSPKVLLNILRLHTCLTLLFDDTRSLADIAQQSGFYDQAHFTKTVKRYTGILPTDLLKQYLI